MSDSEPGSPRWTIADYVDGDEGRIVALFERVFAKPMGASESLDHWRWKFAANPVGPKVIELVWDGEQLVGQYAISPRRLVCNGERQLAALSLDTMTDPDYGRQGIFTASAEASYARLIDNGFTCVYGFPNANSIHGFEKRLDWRVVMPTPVLVKALDVGEFVADKLGRPGLGPLLSVASRQVSRAPSLVDALAARLRGIEALTVGEFEQFEAWADGLWTRCQAQHGAWVIRDHEFLAWRYDARPESDYLRLRVDGPDGEVAGYAVLAFAEREQGLCAFVMDLLVDLEIPGALASLLHGVEQHARDRGCAFASAMAGPGSRYRQALLRQAYLPLPERLFPQELYFGARVFGDGDQALLQPERWQLSWGDIDVL
ncbi:GNAT family N-acetyltransferase [Enhygromyxa salina]|uniref:GNAT family N-acetyltransferase n=1 Tax=Enhygromyxa salina TaxID=215803 RepID=UPI0015E79FF1|nr:GNAT family N-acetyltransferase [Enhygromyxa salina]